MGEGSFVMYIVTTPRRSRNDELVRRWHGWNLKPANLTYGSKRNWNFKLSLRSRQQFNRESEIPAVSSRLSCMAFWWKFPLHPSNIFIINSLIYLFIRLFIYLFIFRYQDDHNQTWFLIIATMRWLGVCLDMICVVFVAFVVFLAITTKSGSGKKNFCYPVHSNYGK